VDIPGIQHVINFDVPVSVFRYLHRVGRTARAGASGNSYILLMSKEKVFMKQVNELTQTESTLMKIGKNFYQKHQNFAQVKLPDYQMSRQTPRNHLDVIKNSEKKKEKEKFASHNIKRETTV